MARPGSAADPLYTVTGVSAAGTRRVEVGADPAANTEFTITVPAGKLWVPLSLSVVLVQGATNTPMPHLVLDDGTTIFARVNGANAAQAADTTARYTWTRGASNGGAILFPTPNSNAVATMPQVELPAGYRVRSDTPSKGANTDYGAPALYIIEYSV